MHVSLFNIFYGRAKDDRIFYHPWAVRARACCVTGPVPEKRPGNGRARARARVPGRSLYMKGVAV